MTNNRATIEASPNTVRGPWDQSVHPTLPVAVPATDPRLELSENALVLASQNAFPIVATRKTRRDNLGLAAGGAIALVLGAATFMSLNSSRHAPAAPAAMSATQVQQQPGVAMATTAFPGRPIAAPPGAMPVSPQPAPMPAAGPMPGSVTMPGMAPGGSPVLVYDGSTPQSM